MSLNTTEEAQLRALIAQQAAILSLASSEPTIISKLAATKVSLADLTAATSLNDADLFLVRQGTTEKSVAKLVFSNGFAASGANADITSLGSITSINGGQLGGLRNKIINGGFVVNQRDYASGSAVGTVLYAHDRWKMAASADTYTFSTTVNKTTITIPAGKVLRQVIEGLNLQSGTYTLSWDGTAQGKIGAGSLSAPGVTGSITGGTNTTIEFGPGTVANVQLELGTVATEFEQRPYGMEFALCQRYLPAINSSGAASNPLPASGIIATATSAVAVVNFPVTSRVPPTGLTASNPNHFTASDSNATPVLSSIVFGEANTFAAFVNLTGSGWIQGRSLLFYFNNVGGKLLFTGCEL